MKNSHIAYVFLKKQRKIHEFTIYDRFWKIMFFSKNTKNLNIGRIVKNFFMIWNIVNWRFSNLQFKEKKFFFVLSLYFLMEKIAEKNTFDQYSPAYIPPTPLVSYFFECHKCENNFLIYNFQKKTLKKPRSSNSPW